MIEYYQSLYVRKWDLGNHYMFIASATNLNHMIDLVLGRYKVHPNAYITVKKQQIPWDYNLWKNIISDPTPFIVEMMI